MCNLRCEVLQFVFLIDISVYVAVNVGDTNYFSILPCLMHN